jgi:subtilisin family serine protease
VGAVDVPGWAKLCSGPQVRIAVVDDYWNRHHEDLVGVEVVSETGRCGVLDDHGTSVVGILLSNDDGHGLVGVAPGSGLVFSYPYVPGASGSLVYSVADAIDRASAELRVGDVLLIERQIAGNPVETVRPCFDAIRHAAARGIIVIEPAGNAGGYLDDYVPPTPGHRKPGGSGAILVGAGIESSPQHGRPRARIPLSCYGSCVDVQAWGAGVLTLATPSESTSQSTDEAYKSFGGTSSASAIVAGVAAVASSVTKRLAPDVPLSSDMLRSLMVETGSPQFPGSADEPIGPQPDLAALLRAVRRQLCKEKGLPPPSGRPPSLDVRERWLLQLLVNGLDEAAIATIMGLDRADVLERAGRLRVGLGAETRLQLAQAVDHWDLA